MQINDAIFPQTIAQSFDFVGFPDFPRGRQPNLSTMTRFWSDARALRTPRHCFRVASHASNPGAMRISITGA
jgi:hypothetical protein